MRDGECPYSMRSELPLFAAWRTTRAQEVERQRAAQDLSDDASAIRDHQYSIADRAASIIARDGPTSTRALRAQILCSSQHLFNALDHDPRFMRASQADDYTRAITWALASAFASAMEAA